jgi:transcriptional regulator with GAF, ATPase, and Fis domain
MPLEAQVKLLRVLQEKELERIGGRATVKVNVRIIAATNRNLEDEVRQGRFRSDLYYRLNVFPIQLPSLRDRVEDIETLANFFLRRYSKSSGRHITSISPKVISQLEGYAWPGNVRELEHMIERSVLLTRGNTLMEVSLPRGVTTSSGNVRHKALREIERSYIIDVLRKYKGKVSGEGGAADILQIPATTLHSKMKRLGITKIDYWSVL